MVKTIGQQGNCILSGIRLLIFLDTYEKLWCTYTYIIYANINVYVFIYIHTYMCVYAKFLTLTTSSSPRASCKSFELLDSRTLATRKTEIGRASVFFPPFFNFSLSYFPYCRVDFTFPLNPFLFSLIRPCSSYMEKMSGSYSRAHISCIQSSIGVLIIYTNKVAKLQKAEKQNAPNNENYQCMIHKGQIQWWFDHHLIQHITLKLAKNKIPC